MKKNETQNKDIGCYYFHAFYPSNMFLNENDNFSFVKDSIKYLVLITKHLKSLVINDFGNKLIKGEENNRIKYQIEKGEIKINEKNIAIEIENGAYHIIDYEKHYRKELFTVSYTELVISFESSPTEDNFKLANEALVFFVDSYKIVSDDFFTLSHDKMPFFSKVYKYFFHHYSKDELLMPSEVRMKVPREISFSFHQITVPHLNAQLRILTKESAEISKNLKTYFDENKKAEPLAEYILKASEELYVHKNYKYSLIESWTALEIAIVSYLTRIKLEKGISKKRIDNFEGEVGISYLINIELPLVHPDYNQNLKDLLVKIDVIRKLRNKVIHENKLVLESDATNAIKTLVEFLNYIGYKKY